MAARVEKKLTAREAASLAAPGRHSDGGGLFLSIDPAGRRRWVFLFTRAGKRREMGLGAANGPHAVTLAQARARAAEARGKLAEGIDPIADGKARRAALERAQGVAQTFGGFADEYVATMESGWRNAKHAKQWAMTLTTYCAPLRARALDAIDTEAVLEVLKPIWTAKAETAGRVRGRIENVLDAAKAKGLRSGENPARWRGHLDRLLPKRQRLARGHHAAMPFAAVPGFIEALRAREATAARALEFVILTAARTGEALGVTWAEVDLDKGVWTAPPHRMKAGRAHRVPLSVRALEILREMEAAREDDDGVVFAGADGGPLSNMAMAALLKRMDVKGVTVHGFRSAFRDWAAETTAYPNELAEAALAHVVGDKVEAAYRRGDLFERRRAMMADWAAFCGGRQADNVVSMWAATGK